MKPHHLMDSKASPDPHIEATATRSCTCIFPRNPPECDLQPGSHQYPDLVQMITRYASHAPFYHPKQFNAYREAGSALRQFHVSNFPSIDNLRKWARIFDDLFFFGAVHEGDRCLVDWHQEGNGMVGTTKTCSGCLPHQQIFTVQILIEPFPCEDVKGSLFLSIVRTLLHELCHSALILYGCKNTMDARTHVKYFGLTGHGSSFLDLYQEILRAAEKTFGISLITINGKNAISSAYELEQKALNNALKNFGATALHIPIMDLEILERAIGGQDGRRQIFWKPQKLPNVE